MTTLFYDKAWNEWNDMIRYSPAPRIRRERVMSWIRRLPASSLLDVGCGNAEFLRYVAESRPGLQLAGADISADVIQKNRTRFPSIEFFEIDLNHAEVKRDFDIVICMEVIEHCLDPHAVIAALARMTAGWLIVTVPCGPVFEIDKRCGHTRHFSGDEIMEILASVGLACERLECWGFPFFNLYKRLINLWPDKMCKSFLSAKKYGPLEKMISSITYYAFRACLPCWGYQMFIVASRRKHIL